MSDELREIVINDCFGGFSVSLAAARRMAELGQANAAQDVAEYDAHLAEFQRTGLNPQWGDNVSDVLRKKEPKWFGYLYDTARDDPALVQVVKEMGGTRGEAAGDCASLSVVEIPADVAWHIEEYDGNETIHEDHRSWRS